MNKPLFAIKNWKMIQAKFAGASSYKRKFTPRPTSPLRANQPGTPKNIFEYSALTFNAMHFRQQHLRKGAKNLSEMKLQRAQEPINN